MLGGDQLQHRVAQVLQPLIVLQPGFGMLIVVRPVRQGLAQEGLVVEPDPQRTLELLEWLLAGSRLSWRGRTFPGRSPRLARRFESSLRPRQKSPFLILPRTPSPAR